MSTNPPASPPDRPTTPESRARRPNWRLRAMLVFTTLALGLYGFVRLDRSVAEWLGPVGEGVHDLFNQVPGKAPTLTRAGRLLVKDVAALGGDAGANVTRRGYFGTFGQEEWFNVTAHTLEFDDKALAHLADTHGDQIGGLYLQNSGVTDAGLRSLSKFTMLRHLNLRGDASNTRSGTPEPSPKITDAGLIHLKGLDHLGSLDLSDRPITDAGLESINELPELLALYLSRTKVQGRGLSRLKSLPRLSILYLDDTPMTEEGLKALLAATKLQYLSLNQVLLTPDALPLLKAIPRIDHLELTGCGFLDEEVADLIKSKPKLKINRR